MARIKEQKNEIVHAGGIQTLRATAIKHNAHTMDSGVAVWGPGPTETRGGGATLITSMCNN